MRQPAIYLSLCIALILLATSSIAASDGPLPIIPGAAGFGIETPAGSGRHLDVPKTSVYKVTNLNTEGPGSLAEAIQAEGPRVVVFEVSGNIDFRPLGNLSISNPYLTIAGQTAPSPGITLVACQLHIRADDVLLQHLRVRVGDLRDPTRPEIDPKSGWSQWSERDCMKVGGDRVVVDHCSFSWATDENVQTRGNHLTFRNCIFSEGLESPRHHKGGHSKGLLIMNQGPTDARKEGQNIAVIGNLFANNKDRNPNVSGGVTAVVANNLTFGGNVGLKAVDDAQRGPLLFSAIGNVFQQTNSPLIARAWDPGTRLYFAPDQLIDGKTYATTELWKHVYMPFQPGVAEANRAMEPPIKVPGLVVRPAADVEPWVLANVGARPADRDPVDRRVIESVRKQARALVASQADVGGWPELKQNRRPLTLPANPSADDNGNGYTNLEEWLHGFARQVEGEVVRPVSLDK